MLWILQSATHFSRSEWFVLAWLGSVKASPLLSFYKDKPRQQKTTRKHGNLKTDFMNTFPLVHGATVTRANSGSLTEPFRGAAGHFAVCKLVASWPHSAQQWQENLMKRMGDTDWWLIVAAHPEIHITIPITDCPTIFLHLHSPLLPNPTKLYTSFRLFVNTWNGILESVS